MLLRTSGASPTGLGAGGCLRAPLLAGCGGWRPPSSRSATLGAIPNAATWQICPTGETTSPNFEINEGLHLLQSRPGNGRFYRAQTHCALAARVEDERLRARHSHPPARRRPPAVGRGG